MPIDGNASGTIYQTDTVYGSCGCSPPGKMIQQSLPHAPTAQPVWTTYTYDGIGRTISVLAPDGASTTTYSYQGNTVTVTDPAGKWKTFTMDAFRHLTQVAEPNPAGGSNYVTSYTYDAWDNLSQVSMPRPSGTQTRTFTYNGKLLMSATNPENGTVSYTYNSYNKVATKTDAKGQVFTYAYDGYARLTSLSVGSTVLESYIYDTTQNSNYPNYSQGRLTGVTYSTNYGGGFYSPGFTETYGYSQAGQKTNKGLLVTQYVTESCNGNNICNNYATVDLESVYAYNNEGKMTSIGYPNGANYGYGYDTMARLYTMTNLNTSAQIITETNYDPANRLLSISGNLTESRTYNAMGQLTQLTSSATSGPSLNVTYNYSSTQNNGKITSQTDNISGEQVVYAYDALNRLASAGATSNTWGQSYTYDGFGNLLDQTVTEGTAPSLSVAYNAANNLQTTDCADANGNITGSEVDGHCTSQLYSYDAKNRIASAAGIYYAYAPGNKRVWRGQNTNGGVNEVAFWSVTGQKLATCNLTPGQPVDQNGTWMATLACTGGVTNTYFGGKLLSNGTGNVVQDRLGSVGKFYPWGQEKPSATTNGTEKFTAYFRDSETGNDYAQNRYHQPGMGRFFTVDKGAPKPASPGSWNRYAYVAGDPVNSNDPSGRVACPSDDPDCLATLFAEGYGSVEQCVAMTQDPEGCTSPLGDAGGCVYSSDDFYGSASNYCNDSDQSGGGEAPEIECDITLGGSSLGTFVHTYLTLTTSNATTGVTQTSTLEGLPMPKTPGAFGVGPILLGNDWLNGFLYSGTTSGSELYDFADKYSNTQLCNDISKLTTAAGAYNNGVVTYNFLGPNSNTFISYMLGQANMSVSGNVLTSLFFEAPGWFAAMPPNP